MAYTAHGKAQANIRRMETAQASVRNSATVSNRNSAYTHAVATGAVTPAKGSFVPGSRQVPTPGSMPYRPATQASTGTPKQSVGYSSPPPVPSAPTHPALNKRQGWFGKRA